MPPSSRMSPSPRIAPYHGFLLYHGLLDANPSRVDARAVTQRCVSARPGGPRAAQDHEKIQTREAIEITVLFPASTGSARPLAPRAGQPVWAPSASSLLDPLDSLN